MFLSEILLFLMKCLFFIDVKSFTSSPLRILKILIVSLTFLLIIPTVSNDGEYGITPKREILPHEGLNPTTPQKAAGLLQESPVSVAIENLTIPFATW